MFYIIPILLDSHFTSGQFDFEYENVGMRFFSMTEHVKSQFSYFDDSPTIIISLRYSRF